MDLLKQLEAMPPEERKLKAAEMMLQKTPLFGYVLAALQAVFAMTASGQMFLMVYVIIASGLLALIQFKRSKAAALVLVAISFMFLILNLSYVNGALLLPTGLLGLIAYFALRKIGNSGNS